MADRYFARLSEDEDFPPFFDGIVTSLDDLFATLASLGIEVTFEDPDYPPNTEPDPETPPDEEAGMSATQDDTDEAPPDIPDEPASGETPREDPETKRLVTVQLEALSEIEVGLPALEGISLVLNPSPFQVTMSLAPRGFVIGASVELAVRFKRELLVPMRDAGGGEFEEDPTTDHVDIVVAAAIVEVTENGVSVEFPTGLRLARPAMIGQTGIIIESADLAFNFDGSGDRPDGAPAGWKGVLFNQASIRIPAVYSGAIVANKLGFGSGGVTGEVARTFPPDFSNTIFGMPGGITEVALTLRENILTRCEITAQVKIPFFDQENPLGFLITIATDGTVTATLAGSLATLQRDGIVRFDVTSITFGIEDGESFTAMSGVMRPLVAGLAWPGFEVRELRVDAHGNVTSAGGWIDLPAQATLELFGFLFEITRMGFGKTEAGENWIGFNGSLRLLEGIPTGTSVEGLRILWGGPEGTRLTMEGIGVDLEVPGMVRIAGKVSLGGDEFAGAVRVEIPAISFQTEGQFVVGNIEDEENPGTFFKSYAVFLQTQLPAGIPLGPSGLAFYGLAGLYAHNREPAKEDTEGWYRGPRLEDGWFTRGTDGVTDLDNKWRGARGEMALGAGIILGTFPDNGFLLNGRLLLIVTLPGPTVLIEGMANLFKQRTRLGDANEPNFHALMVIEPEKSFTAGLDARYKFAGGGQLLDIHGSAEAFFDYNNPRGWFINIGVDAPLSRRVGARIFKLFDVDGYFMLNPAQLQVGAGWRYKKTWGWKHLNVTLRASIEGGAIVSWHPAHFKGGVRVQGSAELRAYTVSAGISVGATVSGDVFDPFGMRGSFKARLKLPGPLPDIRKTVVIRWRHDHQFSTHPDPPALPVPIREASIEHLKSQNSWPLVQGQSLRSDDAYNAGSFGFERPGNVPPTPVNDASPATVVAPRVPADSKVAITFTRPVNDPNMLTMNPVTVAPEMIGNPSQRRAAFTIGYELSALELQKWTPVPAGVNGQAQWTMIRRGAPTTPPPPDTEPRLLAAWVPGTEDPALGYSEQHKLFVNAQTPFDYLAERSTAWVENFAQGHPSYPCTLAQPELSARYTQEIGTEMPKDFTFQPPAPAFRVSISYGGDITENDEIIASVLGPIDRGMRVTTLATIFPPASKDDVLVRVGAPRPVIGQSLFAATPVGSAPNPFGNITENPLDVITTFAGRDAGSAPVASNNIIQLADGTRALEIGWRAEIDLSTKPVVYADVVFASDDTNVNVEAFVVGPDGSEGRHHQFPIGQTVVRFRAKDHLISKIVIRRTDSFRIAISDGPLLLPAAALVRVTVRRPVVARVSRTTGPEIEITEGPDGFIRAHVEGLTLLSIPGSYTFQGFLLLEYALPAHSEELIRHIQSSLTELLGPDPLLEPENDYRLVVTTVRDDVPKGDTADIIDHTNTYVHHAHFHVVGPPGVGRPELPEQNPASKQANSLEDLRLYVEQTVPPTIPAQGDKLLVPRAFYRGYDVGVKFNESYVQILYVRTRRSLSVRLYEVDNSPVIAPDGRIAIPTPGWEQSRISTQNEAITRWVGMVNQSECRPTDLPPVSEADIPRNQTLAGPAADVVLAPETLHQARLVPALLHETFIEPIPGLVANGATHRLERWVAGTPSSWSIDSALVPGGGTSRVFFVKETTGAAATLRYVGPLGAPPVVGTDTPTEWTDVRASAVVRWGSGIVGLEVRHSNAGSLRVTLERTPGNLTQGTRRLTSIVGGVATVLAQDTGTFPGVDSDLPITIEAVGDRVRFFQDNEPVFDETGVPLVKGTVGLRVEAAAPTRFTEIRVDDLRPTPAAAFTFDFVTSKYTNFHHHLHSFPERVLTTLPGTALSAADLSGQVAASIPIPGASPDGLGAVTDAERRAFETLEAKALDRDVLRTPEGIEIFRASAAGEPLALLVRSPEPFLWERTLVDASTTDDASLFEIPGDLKLTDVSFGAAPADESVTVLVRSRRSLARHRLEWKPLPTLENPAPAWNLYFAFDDDEPELADGTQVRIFAVAPEHAPAREPGTVQKFVAPDEMSEEVHFGAPGVELRLLGPDGTTVAHQRRFRTADGFTAFPLRAVRKLDGTGIILFATAGAPPATVRLRWTFNRGVGLEDLRYRQGGSETPETAVLDLVLAAPG